MEIRTLDVRLLEKGSSCCPDLDGVRHVKVLPWISLVQSQQGFYEVALGTGAAEKTQPGGFFLAPGNLRQEITHRQQQSPLMECRWLFFEVILNGNLSLDSQCDLPTILPQEICAQMDQIFDKLFATTDLCQEYSLLYEMLGLLLPLATPKTSPDPLRPAVQYIQAHYAKPITVADLAEAVHMSPSHLHACFKDKLGISPIAYLNRYRLSLAARLLRETNHPVRAIAASVGIDDPLYFGKQFRRIYQVPPGQYRKLATSKLPADVRFQPF